MNKIEEIKNIMNKNNGYITTTEANNSNIHRMYLKIMHDKGLIERVGKGIYIDSNLIEDSYYILSLELPRIIYSHMTALYFHGLSIKAPDGEYDITVPKNYYNYKLKKHYVFYVNKDIYELGLMEIKTPMGNLVKRKDKDLVKLSNYAKKMGILEEVTNYLEVFYE